MYAFLYIDLYSKYGKEGCVEINWENGWNDAPCDRSDRGRFVCKKSSERGELSQKIQGAVIDVKCYNDITL